MCFIFSPERAELWFVLDAELGSRRKSKVIQSRIRRLTTESEALPSKQLVQGAAMISVLALLPFRSRFTSGILLATILAVTSARAADLRIKIPKRTKPTPVQQLNQEGVKALAKNDTARAKRAFYRAYLLDPDDPFTLNNLGYAAELDGDMPRAQKFYDLAAANSSNAAIAFSNDPELDGKQVSQVLGSTVTASMQVNRLNVAAMGLLAKDRAPEAEIALRKALTLAPNNPFTLNNLGYALEKEGELEEAVHLYDRAAASNSNEKIVVALNRNWRGRSISEIANRNAQAARRELGSEGSSEAKVARLNLRGVSALNRNQLPQARQYFQQAYQLDPDNAFALNNMGYISEVDGDRETADFYYAKAREANRSSARVALATRKTLQGMRLTSVADQNEQSVQSEQEKQLAVLRARGAPPLPLRTRDQAVVREPATPPRPEPETPVRIVAEDNPPPERPAAMAAPAQPANRIQSRSLAQTTPAQSQSVPAAPQVTPAQPQDETPLLPVIPDETAPPSR
jgi:Flp pilus assembly protein TadD